MEASLGTEHGGPSQTHLSPNPSLIPVSELVDPAHGSSRLRASVSSTMMRLRGCLTGHCGTSGGAPSPPLTAPALTTSDPPLIAGNRID